MEPQHAIKVRLRLVIVNDGKLLVTYDSKDNYCYYIGGKLERYETVLDGINREILEELGDDVKFEFKKILYIRDYINKEKNEHSLELFILGTINKVDELEGLKDPEHNGQSWSTWVDINNLPSDLYPKALSKKLKQDYEDDFEVTGEYIGRMEE